MECRSIVIACILAVLCASCGPRMRDQVSIKPYKTTMPTMPAGTVPTTGRQETQVSAQVALKTAPIPATPTNISDGKIYYVYYCLMCHGEKGDGNGPVGESYIPKPADLTSTKIARLTDGQLLSKMLHGVGHDPVMAQTVLPNHRWPLVLYVKTLSH